MVNVTVTNSHGPSVVSPQDEFTYRNGYWFTASQTAGVFAYGNSPFWGSAGGTPSTSRLSVWLHARQRWLLVGGLRRWECSTTGTPSFTVGRQHPPQPADRGHGGHAGRRGYWLVAADGGIFSFGDARFSAPPAASPSTSRSSGWPPHRTATVTGWWLRRGVFTFGDANFDGSTGGYALNKPVVGMASSVDGLGYWLVASDGGIFSFGDAIYHGRTGNITLTSRSSA